MNISTAAPNGEIELDGTGDFTLTHNSYLFKIDSETTNRVMTIRNFTGWPIGESFISKLRALIAAAQFVFGVRTDGR